MERTFIVKWLVKKSETARIRSLLPELVARTKAEQGNLLYAIYQAEADPNVFLLHERYTDAEAVDVHRSSEHYQRLVVREIIPHLAGREVTAVTQVF
jgi:quinol monooxygenase YgiN